MANTNTNVVPTILAMSMRALRENAILPQLVNKEPYTTQAAGKGNVINIPIPSAITARSVTPAVTQAANQDWSPTTVACTLDRWMEATVQASDNDLLSVADGTLPMQFSEAMKALGNDIDTYILGKHVGFFNIGGVAGTTPTTIATFASARTVLNKSLAPQTPRYGVLDPDAEAAFLAISNVLQFDQRGDQEGIIKGTIGEKLGIEWHMDQNLTANTFTPGTAWTTSWTFDGSNPVAATTAAVVFTGSGTVKIGDIFSLTAGGLGYVITVATTMVTATTQNISFYPGLRSAVATASALIIVGSTATAYVPNLVFHRDAFAFASRPLQDATSVVGNLGNIIASQTDPVTGIALRLEVSRQYRQTTWSFDILYGACVARRELGAKIKG